MSGAPSDAPKRVVEFAERCHTYIRDELKVDRELPWKADDGTVWFHCPLEGHQYKGDDQPAWARSSGGKLIGGCRKCGDGKADETWITRVRELIGWEDDPKQAGEDVEVLREHVFTTMDDRFQVLMQKVKRGRKQPTFEYATRKMPTEDSPIFGRSWSRCWKPNEWVNEHYPINDGLNSIINWYRHDQFLADGKRKAIYQVALCEGAKDADTFRQFTEMLGKERGVPFATALPSPSLKVLANHQLDYVRGVPVYVIGDADEGGDKFRKKWSGLLHEVASEVVIVDAEALFGKGSDLTDWTEKRVGEGASFVEIATELMEALDATPAQTEPLESPTGWRQKMLKDKSGRPLKSELYNATLVWREHPDLSGKLRRNIRSGEIEVYDPPWGDGVCVGARKCSLSCASWLSEEYKVSLSPKALEDACEVDGLAVDFNPVAELVDAQEWDGKSRIEDLFTHYLPLEGPPEPLRRLSKIFLQDMAAKAAGHLVPQRHLIGIVTDEHLDIAWALGRSHGIHRRGKVEMTQVAALARQQAMLVQIGLEPLTDRTMARGSIACLFDSHIDQPYGLIPSPSFIAVGPHGESMTTAVSSSVDHRVIMLRLDGSARLGALQNDAEQLLAEASAKLGEDVRMVHRRELVTVDDEAVDDNLREMARLIWRYTTYQIDRPEGIGIEPVKRQKPLEFVVRSMFLTAMRLELEPKWRGENEQAKVFNAVCRRLGFTFQKKIKVQLTRRQLREEVPDVDGRPDITGDRQSTVVPGVRITTKRREKLEEVVETSDMYPKYTSDYTEVSTLKNQDYTHYTSGPSHSNRGPFADDTFRARICVPYIEERGIPEPFTISDFAGRKLSAVRVGKEWAVAVDDERVTDLDGLQNAISCVMMLDEELPELTDEAGAWLTERGIEPW